MYQFSTKDKVLELRKLKIFAHNKFKVARPSLKHFSIILQALTEIS